MRASLTLAQDEEEEIKVEIDVLRKFSAHPNLTKFFGVWLTKVCTMLW